MWLVLTDHCDPLAPWLADGLRCRAPETVLALNSLDLINNVSLDHRVDADDAYFRLETCEGYVVDSRDVTAVFNRLQTLPPQAVTALHPTDRSYSVAEMGALILSCLQTFRCPMLNPPSSQGFSGSYRLDFEWAALAARAGLKCHARQATPFAAPALIPRDTRAAELETVRALVVGHTVLTPPDVLVELDVLEACRRLAQLAQAPLLAIDLLRAPHGAWRFVGADARTDPSPYGIEALDAIAETFSETRPTLLAVPHPRARRDTAGSLALITDLPLTLQTS